MLISEKIYQDTKKCQPSFKMLMWRFFLEQCTICQTYFVRNACDLSYLIRQITNRLHVFCSQSCRSHFMHKYQMLEMCSICRRRKSNFNMIKIVQNGTSIQINYCSIQCLQIIEDSIALEQAFKKISTDKQWNKSKMDRFCFFYGITWSGNKMLYLFWILFYIFNIFSVCFCFSNYMCFLYTFSLNFISESKKKN